MIKKMLTMILSASFIVAGLCSGSRGEEPDTTPPSGSIAINNGASATNSTAVTLTLNAVDNESGVSQMQFSNDNNSWSAAEPFASSKTWTLSDGEGLKTVYVKYKDNAGNWSSAYSSVVTLDSIAPAVTITSPLAYTTRDNRPLLAYSIADAGVISSVTVTVDGAPVSTPSGGNLDLLSNGTHTISVGAIDTAGNSGSAMVSFTVNNTAPLAISGVNASRNTINTANFESAAIYYTVNSHATMTFKIIPEKLGIAGAPVSTMTNSVSGAGMYSFIWDGTNSSNGKAVPDEAYLYKLEASDGMSSAVYSGTTPTRQGTVSCSVSSGNYDPIKNLPVLVNYAVSNQATRVTVGVISSAGGLNTKLLNAFPSETGSFSVEWDVHKDTGQPWTMGGISSYCTVSTALRDNHITTTGDTPEITLIKTDPYLLNLSYGQFTRIQYSISRDADITIAISPPFAQSTANAVLLWSGPAAAGILNEYEWRGLDPADSTAKKFFASEEGLYTLSIQATNPETGSSRTRRGCVRIQY